MRSSAELPLGLRGQLVIPARLRRALGIEPGDTLVATVEGDRLILEPRRAVLARLRARFSAIPHDVVLVDELIAERREEALRERPS